MLPCLRAPITRSRPLARLYSQFINPPVTTPNKPGTPNASTSDEMSTHGVGSTGPSALQEGVQGGEKKRHLQAPNREDVWSKSQKPRELGMVGPRFEQTIIGRQPAPYAAIELIHQQPVRWSEKRVVTCDGGGGPLGHPRIFINVDKPEITPCGYCGLPFAHVHHKETLSKLEKTDYPLA